jgi:hypothetical protein
VTEIQPRRPLALAEVHEQLRGKVTTQRKLDLWRSYVADHLRSADVTYAADYEPGNPDALPSMTDTGALQPGPAAEPVPSRQAWTVARAWSTGISLSGGSPESASPLSQVSAWASSTMIFLVSGRDGEGAQLACSSKPS